MESQVPVVAYASLSRRAVALIIDSVILGSLGFVGGHLIPALGAVLVWLLYAPVLESSTIRATVGKHLMRIQVCDLHGQRITFQIALVRNVMKFVSTSLVLIGFFFAFFTHRRQALHDLVAQTVVLDGSVELPIGDAWVASAKDAFHFVSASTPAPDPSILTQLERLQSLRERGAITDDEFLRQKQVILGRAQGV